MQLEPFCNSDKPPSLKKRVSEPNLGQKVAAGVAWTALVSLAGRGISLLSQLILAKLLFPEDFGLFGLAMTVSAIFNVLTSFGIDQVFIQRYPRMHLWATQAFLLSLGFSLLAAFAMALTAPVAAHYYHNDGVVPLIWLMALSLPFSALTTLPTAQLRSRFAFKYMALYNSFEQIALQSTIIICAWQGLGALSFALPIPILALLRAIIFWRKAPIPLRPMRSSKGWSHMTRRGAIVFIVSLLTACIGQGDYALLGLVASAHVVGIYYFAFKLASQPMMVLASNFTGVLRTSLIAMQGDPARQRKAAMNTAEALGLITIPVSFLQAAIAAPTIILLFGDRWKEAIPLIQILGIALPLDAASWAAGSFLEARGYFHRSLRYQLMTAPLFFLFAGTGAWLASATGVALGVALYYIIHPIFLTLIVFLKEGEKAGKILGCFLRPFLLGTTTIGGVYLLTQIALNYYPIAQIVIILSFGSATYLFGACFISPEIFNNMKSKLYNMVTTATATSKGNARAAPLL